MSNFWAEQYVDRMIDKAHATEPKKQYPIGADDQDSFKQSILNSIADNFEYLKQKDNSAWEQLTAALSRYGWRTAIQSATGEMPDFKIDLNSVQYEQEPTIDITKIEPDERDPRVHPTKYKVNYQVESDGQTIEIAGTLIPYETGRTTDYSFEPDGWYADPSHEAYYDENHEAIEDQIMAKFNGMTFENKKYNTRYVPKF